MPPSSAADVIARLVAARTVDEVGGTPVRGGAARATSERVERLVRDFHQAQPLSEGIPREEVRERLFHGAPLPLFERVLADLATAGVVVGRDRLAWQDGSLARSEEIIARDRLEAAVKAAGSSHQTSADLPAKLQLAPALVARVLGLLVRQKVCVKLDTLYFHHDVLQGLKNDVVGLKTGAAAATVDVAAFKDRYGMSRKYAIPLLSISIASASRGAPETCAWCFEERKSGRRTTCRCCLSCHRGWLP